MRVVTHFGWLCIRATNIKRRISIVIKTIAAMIIINGGDSPGCHAEWHHPKHEYQSFGNYKEISHTLDDGQPEADMLDQSSVQQRRHWVTHGTADLWWMTAQEIATRTMFTLWVILSFHFVNKIFRHHVKAPLRCGCPSTSNPISLSGVTF